MIHQTFAYCDLLTVKDAGNLSDLSGVTTYDNMLLFWAEAASRFINEFCHRDFHCQEEVKYFNGSGGTLMLPVDLLSVSAFALDLDGTGNYATSVAATDYVLNPTYSLPKTYLKIAYNASISSFGTAIPNAVKITGVWGFGDGYSSTPYQDSGVVVNTGNITSGALTHTLAAGKGASFGAGMTVRIGTEQLYITNVSTDTLTLMRGVNGTTAASHTAGDAIYIYQYPSVISGAALMQLSIWWKRRESSYASKSGNAVTGEYDIWKGLDDGVRIMLSSGNMRRLNI